MTEQDQIEELTLATAKLREVTGAKYASASIEVCNHKYDDGSEAIKADYRVYTSETGHHYSSERLCDALNLALAKWNPDSLRAQAEALRAQAFDLEQQAEKLSTPITA